MPTSGYHHLTQNQRCQISILRKSDFSITHIAQKLNLHKSSVSRELKRNCKSESYNPEEAQKRSSSRRSKASQKVTKMSPYMALLIVDGLLKFWSPEQISGRLKLEGGTEISHESIYKYIWKDKKNGGTLWKNLRHRAKKYNRRKGKASGRGLIPNRVDIDQRPKIVEEKNRIGDWEGDTIEGAHHKGAILSLVDRKSKFTFLVPLKRRQAESVTKAVSSIKNKMRIGGPIRTITWDNGKEFSQHSKITKQTGALCYFATPYHSWERGLNEHTNGLVRQFLPKGTEFINLKKKEVILIENLLNSRPRKVLNFRTPEEVFFDAS